MAASVKVSSMASGFCNPHVLLFNSSIKKTASRNRMVIVKSKDMTPKRICSFRFRLITENKVYEDQESGIICYRGDDGQVVCEGLDEGPRRQFPETRIFTDQKVGDKSGKGRIHEDPWNRLPEGTGITDNQRELQILAFLDARFN